MFRTQNPKNLDFPYENNGFGRKFIEKFGNFMVVFMEMSKSLKNVRNIEVSGARRTPKAQIIYLEEGERPRPRCVVSVGHACGLFLWSLVGFYGGGSGQPPPLGRSPAAPWPPRHPPQQDLLQRPETYKNL